jgi:folylpolyglutamate synthase/dihydropteroate synthase
VSIKRECPDGCCRRYSRWESTAAAIERGIAATQWPGRLELISTDPEIILDGAHNPSGARALASYMERFYAGRNICLIYGAMRDKAVVEVTGILFPGFPYYHRHSPRPGPGNAAGDNPRTERARRPDRNSDGVRRVQESEGSPP